MRRVYLDHNATTRVHPEVRAAMAPFLDEVFGNPSSIHAQGRAAREALESARRDVAEALGGAAEEVVFTSGGTESNRLAISGAARAARLQDPRRRRVLIASIEHPSVLGIAEALVSEGFHLEQLRVDAEGRLDEAELATALAEDVALVSVQLANHETGVLQPVARLAALAGGSGACLHTDAVQAAGKLPLEARALGVDLLSISAHKLYGPKGAGALWVRRGRELASIEGAGHQERGRRAGTEHVAGAVGLAAALRLATTHGPQHSARITRLRDRLEAGAVALGARVHGGRGPRLGNTSNLAFEGAPGELLAMALDLEGVAVSTGAACTSGSVAPSPVILALGQAPARAREAIRLSLGQDNTEDEIDAVLAVLPSLVERVRAAMA